MMISVWPEADFIYLTLTARLTEYEINEELRCAWVKPEIPMIEWTPTLQARLLQMTILLAVRTKIWWLTNSHPDRIPCLFMNSVHPDNQASRLAIYAAMIMGITTFLCFVSLLIEGHRTEEEASFICDLG